MKLFLTPLPPYKFIYHTFIQCMFCVKKIKGGGRGSKFGFERFILDYIERIGYIRHGFYNLI